MAGFLKVKGRGIVDGKGGPVHLKGLNLGGWLMMEGYILHSPNRPERQFRRELAGALGRRALEDFDESFRRHFIAEEDVRRIRRLGFNGIRVPFHYRVVEKSPYVYGARGLFYLDEIVRWAGKYKIWVILDLHAAPGSQNHDWHSDSAGPAGLWTKKACQDRTFALWEFLAGRYKDETAVAGYDLLNESVLEEADVLNQFYATLIRRIRTVDKNHILFVEGNRWATDIDCLSEFDDDNYVLSLHSYEPLEFTFNFVPHLRYPSSMAERLWNARKIKEHLSRYAEVSRGRSLPVFVGEFGVNYRGGNYGEDRWLKDMLGCFRAFGFHWTYWTYKAVKNSCFPDGLFSYYENPPWVNRQGPISGWDAYQSCWKLHKKEMTRSWRTDLFEVNRNILRVLQDAL